MRKAILVGSGIAFQDGNLGGNGLDADTDVVLTLSM